MDHDIPAEVLCQVNAKLGTGENWGRGERTSRPLVEKHWCTTYNQKINFHNTDLTRALDDQI